MRRLWIALLAVFAFAPHAWGQGKDYPNRPVKIIVMTASGTSADQTARLLAEQYSSIFSPSSWRTGPAATASPARCSSRAHPGTATPSCSGATRPCRSIRW